MKFTKMQGCGNDYIYINGINNTVENPSELAVKMSNRNFGVGSDGLVIILPSKVADFKMQMFNADGTEAEMCGNAIRCVGKYVFERGLIQNKSIKIETGAGIKDVILITEDELVKQVKVDMGEPILEAKQIPVRSLQNPVVGEMIQVNDFCASFTCVSMGNPHAVTFLEDISNLAVEGVGKRIENAPVFPNKTNVEFVQVIDPDHIAMRVWERGTGETLACGTGACATLVACVLNDLTNRQATIHLCGGDIFVEWNESNNHVFMTGPAEFVFEGQWLL